MLMHDFSRTRKYASRKKDIPKGEEDIFTRRIYLHLFFNPIRRVEQDAAFDKDLFELKTLLEEGRAIEDLADNAQDKVKHFLTIRHYGGRMFVQFVSLCYYEYLNEAMRQIKAVLAKENGNPEHDSKGNLTMEKSLNPG